MTAMKILMHWNQQIFSAFFKISLFCGFSAKMIENANAIAVAVKILRFHFVKQQR
jgi:hypothetical protein